VIVHLPLLADTASDLIRQSLAGLDAGGNVRQQGDLPLQASKQALNPAPDPQSAGDIEKVCGLKDRSTRSIPYQRAHIVGAAQRHPPVRIQQMACLPGLLQVLADLCIYGRWFQGQNQISSGGKRDMSRQAVKNLGEL
jgi:hypothetical protein